MKINKLFEQNKDGLLNIFFTAGYPELGSTINIAQHLDKAGIKLIEIGMPYSDPLADGATIQQSSEVALTNGMNLDIMFKQIEKINQSTGLTIMLMGYLNQMMSFGVEKFLETCQRIGVDGLIIPDLPLEIYEEQYQQLFQQYNIDISFLITPRTKVERIKEADRLTSGFLYLVADNSITGDAAGTFSKEQVAYFERIRVMNLSSPLLIGFGIKTAEQYNVTRQYANGAIIGSEFIRQLASVDSVAADTINGFIKSIVIG